MLKRFTLITLILAAFTVTHAQNKIKPKRDTTELKPVIIKGYLSDQPVISVPASVSVLNAAQLKIQPDNSFVNALNTVPGVRTEERSPGSYRLSIRGSLLRSPFGVRDVKIYFDDIPLTDAGGNSYLNAIDIAAIQKVEILKGPDGSLFGANSGGVVILSPLNRYNDSTYISAGINGGSYGLFHEKAAVQLKTANYLLNINQSFQTYHGYRQNSDTHRNYLQLADSWNYSSKNTLKALGIYSDLAYQTPGGLNLAQYTANPRLARQPTATLPGAIQQRIGITTKMYLGGLTNEYHFNDHVRNVLAVFGNHVDFANPFITNYEQRSENTYGFRTYFELTGDNKPNLDWKVDLGFEWQQTNSHIANYGNKKGVKDTTQTIDDIHTNQHFVFVRYAADVYKRLHVEAAVSLNDYGYDFKNLYPLNQNNFTNRNFSAQLMPRLALSYQFINALAWRASVSRGYSSPTTAEVRPTDNIVNTSLQAQYGWNYEAGFRLRNSDETFMLDASVYYYRLNNAIVRRLNANETEHYINAGGTNQLGTEASLYYWIIRPNRYNFIRGLQLNESFTYSHFRFRDYMVTNASYSGNRLTGVPKNVFVSSLQIRFPESIALFVQHTFTSKIPLNDASTVYAPKYNLLQSRVSYQPTIGRKIRFEIFAAADNLLNQKYSLGNDLNAVGNRYYNAAPLRNYSVGMNFMY
ncbi:TonB-dependent receptor plug domain-containing protein [Mucilaginibacter rubeus]|uniref:TonB-dependent receptor n=1 Tax=Mucilaginibacter rubeus TaxID=2027860 RepID=A0AAE6JKD2_9SPHI|nr:MULTISPECIES: TonB-dependent receptor [Mucilaginibacter]QEM07497.1 TonB-dependent receptor plug domain-containing protein [Mucilaginibacter rubeus]QEM19951.1 TonB-dependent receptor plug domain-containing protein [Mucilaginibacter gossypii]QTE43341.1 TonB-dependent receptor [Mucilaginibacter rubeus]QTE49941.1 TonB-dependent receptor [Mucilaginibacter rubeus]QTE55032.1 TonB-dependent receptor [Mucilaginibacter rubeus]